MINTLTENKAGILYAQRRDWDKVIKRRASINKARILLGYEPKTDMEIGLKRVYAWFNDNVENIKKSEARAPNSRAHSERANKRGKCGAKSAGRTQPAHLLAQLAGETAGRTASTIVSAGVSAGG
jgi:hypothetical protein